MSRNHFSRFNFLLISAADSLTSLCVSMCVCDWAFGCVTVSKLSPCRSQQYQKVNKIRDQLLSSSNPAKILTILNCILKWKLCVHNFLWVKELIVFILISDRSMWGLRSCGNLNVTKFKDKWFSVLWKKWVRASLKSTHFDVSYKDVGFRVFTFMKTLPMLLCYQHSFIWSPSCSNTFMRRTINEDLKELK